MKDEITAAIGAHGRWKAVLLAAIESGTLDTPVDRIERDDDCTFGVWLGGDSFSPADLESREYQVVKALHADFHRAAAKVARLAHEGKQAEARKLMAYGGEFVESSARLTRAMVAWAARVG